ncbi:hypothetical protein BH09BAC3_BH09BAC3_29710 [soil metagenome]
MLGALLLPEISWAQNEKKEEKKEEEEKDAEHTFPLENFYAKIKNRPRSIFKNFKFSFSTGYGNTFVSHELPGFGVYQTAGAQPSIFSIGSPNIRFTNWVNDVRYDSTTIAPGSFLASSDTAKLGFKGNALNIPFKLTIHYEFKGKYRIGAGYSYELMNIGSLHPISYGDKISNFQPPSASGWMSKYFAVLGVSFYRLGDYLFTGDAQIGGYNPGANFNKSLIQSGIYVNVGVTAERELSEYLRLFVRPSFEIKSYTLGLPEGGRSIDHNINAFYLNVGLTYSIPDLPKCFIPDCKIQMNHAHGDREYRSRVHPIYKKQNPQYGENHPKLIKYKGKNKKMLNPY